MDEHEHEDEREAEPQVGPPSAFGVRRAGGEDPGYYAYGPDAVSTATLMGVLYMRTGEPMEMVDATEAVVGRIGKP